MDLLRELHANQEAIKCLLQRVENGDFTTEEVADTIEALNGTIEQNCDDIATVMLSQEGEMKSIISEIERLSDRLDDIDSKYARLKNGLKTYLKNKGVKKVHTINHDFSICKNGGKLPLELTGDVPSEFLKYEPKPNAEAIRKALDKGVTLDFAHYGERGEHFRIK